MEVEGDGVVPALVLVVCQSHPDHNSYKDGFTHEGHGLTKPALLGRWWGLSGESEGVCVTDSGSYDGCCVASGCDCDSSGVDEDGEAGIAEVIRVSGYR